MPAPHPPQERVRLHRVLASVVGFSAVMLIVKPGGGASFRPAGLVALLAACSFSLYLLFTRRLQLGPNPTPAL